MEILKRKTGQRYREMIWINGKQFKSPLFKRKADAVTWKAQKLQERSEQALYGSAIVDTKLTLEEFYLDWIENIIKAKRTIGTYNNYKANFIKYILPKLGAKKINGITIKDGNLLVSNLKKNGHNAKGINLIIGSLKSMLNEACRQGVLKESPLRHFQLLKKEMSVPRFMKAEQIYDFLEFHKESPYYPLYLLAFFTGMRRGELAGLCWDVVDLNSNTLIVKRVTDRYGHRETTKSGKARVIPMHPEVLKLLAELKSQRRHDRFVLAREDGTLFSPSQFGNYFRRDQKKFGISEPIRFHDIRHSFASNYMRNGGNIFDLQKILGHSSITMTQMYSHFSPEYLQDSLQFMGIKKQVYPYPTHKTRLQLVENV